MQRFQLTCSYSYLWIRYALMFSHQMQTLLFMHLQNNFPSAPMHHKRLFIQGLSNQ